MKSKLFVLMLGIALLPSLAVAASDFNGSWVRDSANSDPAPSSMWLTMSAGRGGGFGGGPAAARGGAATAGRGGATAGRGFFSAPAVLTVHQDAKSLKVESQGTTHDYTLDGKPHSRPTDTGIAKAEDTADLQGETLVIQTTEPYGGMPGNATLTEKEVWSLSSDGKTLTITTTRDSPAKRETFKQVYNRSESESGAICSAGCITPH